MRAMKTRTLTACLLAAGLAGAAYGQIDVSVGADIRLGHAPPPPPPDVVVVDHAGPPGPPPWAHSHWYRRNRTYYYYPGYDVYFRPADHTWYYLDGGTWRTSRTLPNYVSIDFGRSVTLTMETDRPYVHNVEVRRYYPRDYFAHVRTRAGARFDDRGPPHRDDDHHDERNHGDRHDDRDDHGHGDDHGRGHDKDHGHH